MTINFTEWKQRKQVNRQIRLDFDTIKAHVTTEGLQDGCACVDGDSVVWMPSGEQVTATERHQFTVKDRMVYA